MTLSQLGGAILLELDSDAPQHLAEDLAVNRVIKVLEKIRDWG